MPTGPGSHLPTRTSAAEHAATVERPGLPCRGEVTGTARTLAARVAPDVAGPGIPVAGGILGKAAEAVTLVLLATVVPRVLGPAAYGHFSVVLTVVMIGTTALALGGTPLMSRFVPAAPAPERPALARALGLRLAASRAVQLTLLVVLGAVLTRVVPEAFPPLHTALALGALVANVIAMLALQAGLGLGRTAPWNARYPLQNAVLIGAVVVLHPLAGVTGALVAVVLSAVCALVVGGVAVRGVLGADGPAPPLPDGALRFGREQGTGWALLQCAQRGGVLAVALLAGSSRQTGFAALAIGVALPAVYAVLRLFTVSLPGLVGQTDVPSEADSGEADSGGVAAAEERLRRLAGIVLGVLLPAAALTGVVLEAAVPLVFGTRYAGATGAFVPALALVVLGPVSALLLQGAALRLRPGATLWSALAGAVAFVVAAAVAVPAWGATGGTTAALAGAAVTVLVAARMLPGVVGVRLGAATALGTVAVPAIAVAA